MKILHVIDSGGLYGAEKMLLALVEEQVKQGLDPIILSVGDLNAGNKPLEIAANKQDLPLKVWRMKPGLNLFEAWKIVKWAKSEKVQVFHSHGYKFNILLALMPRFLRGIPLITTVHGYVQPKQYTKMWYYEKTDQALLKFIDRVVVVSKPMLSLPCIKKLSEEKISFVNNGVANQLESRQLTPAITNFIQGGALKIIAIGRLAPEKAFDNLIMAVARLVNEDGIDIRLVIVGEGREKTVLKELIEANSVARNVLLAGYYDNAGSIINAFDSLVISSKTEGLPITLLEAMRAKVLIISTSVGGIPSVVDNECAVLIQPNNQRELYQALLKVHQKNLDVETLTKNAFVKFNASFCAEVMAEGYSSVYSSLKL